jgi:hypothetical protein
MRVDAIAPGAAHALRSNSAKQASAALAPVWSAPRQMISGSRGLFGMLLFPTNNSSSIVAPARHFLR